MSEVSSTAKAIGKHVTWEKIEGKYKASILLGETGFGVLSRLSVDTSMVIWGDNGIITSPVFSIDEVDGGFKVVTNNSVYLVKERE